jgi:SAM-dependent methyltransferase
VDAVIGRHAMQFLDDWPAPLAGFHRVLRPGGRLSFITWASIAENPFLALPVTIPRALGWTMASPNARPFDLSDREALRGQLINAGFDEVHVRRVAFETRMPLDEAIANRLDSPMSRSVIRDLSTEQRTTFQAAIRSAVARMRVGSDAIVSGVSLLVSGTR